jgi:hypothetical protein
MTSTTLGPMGALGALEVGFAGLLGVVPFATARSGAIEGADGSKRGCDACACLGGWMVGVGVDRARMHEVRRVADARAGVADLVPQLLDLLTRCFCIGASHD